MILTILTIGCSVTPITGDDTKGNLTLTRIYGQSGALESEQAYAYTSEGLVKSKTSWNTGTSLNIIEYYYYDNYGNISSVIDGEGNSWDYDFSITGLLESVTDPLGNATRYEYTPAGKITKVTYPDGTSQATFYTNRKDIDYVTDRDGNRYDYTYNKASLQSK